MNPRSNLSRRSLLTMAGAAGVLLTGGPLIGQQV
ncbi:MAG: twin-arginine translocation signal domain-containing protein [Paracoccaceae bacterium]